MWKLSPKFATFLRIRDRFFRWLILTSALCILAWQMTILWLSSPSTDAAIFLAMGRSLLNGLTPYRDLFETKPPGIFLLGAVANSMGGMPGATVLSLLAIVCIVLSCTFAQKSYGALVGVLIALLAADGAGGFYPELFGAASLCVYIALLNLPNHRWKVPLVSVPLFLAICFKETLVLPSLAVAVLLLTNWRSFLWFYAVPMCLAALWFLLLLLSLGALDEYLTLYLPFMVSVRVGGAHNGGIVQLLAWLLRFSPLILVLIPLAAWGTRHHVARSITAVLLAIASAVMGGFSPSHAATVVPVIGAMLLLKKPRYMHYAVLFSIFLVPLRFTPPSLHASWEEAAKVAATVDAIMERCRMDRYAYLGGSSGIYGFTRHSPLGPLLYLEYYMLQSPYLVHESLIRIREAKLIVFEKKKSALSIEKEYYDQTQDYVSAHFQLDPPPCAEQTVNSERFAVFFRKH